MLKLILINYTKYMYIYHPSLDNVTRTDLQKFNEQSAITEVSKQVVDMVTGLGSTIQNENVTLLVKPTSTEQLALFVYLRLHAS